MQQITVIAASGTDLITQLTSLLSENHIDIRDISFRSSEQQAIAQVLVDDYDRALQLIAKAGLNAFPHESVVIELEDKPGALAEISKKISAAGIAIRALNLVPQNGGIAFATVNTDNNDRVRELFPLQSLN